MKNRNLSIIWLVAVLAAGCLQAVGDWTSSGTPSPPLARLYFGEFLPILIGNVAVIITCLIAGARPWSRSLCAISLWLTGLFLLLGAALFTMFYLATSFSGDAAIALPYTVRFWIPVAFEFVALLAVAWRLHASRPPPLPMQYQ